MHALFIKYFLNIQLKLALQGRCNQYIQETGSRSKNKCAQIANCKYYYRKYAKTLIIQYYLSFSQSDFLKKSLVFFSKKQMFPLTYQPSQTLVLKIYLLTFIFALAIYYPFTAYREVSASNRELAKFQSQFLQRNNAQVLEKEQEEQLDFGQLIRLLQKRSFSGSWVNSIKQSKLLTAENGTFYLKIQPVLNDQFYLKMSIFDGKYSENCIYQINVQNSAIKTKQKIGLSNFLIYQTINPIIALQKKNCIFSSEKQKPIYINKMKFKVSFENDDGFQINQNLKRQSSQNQMSLQILLAAQYDINIIASDVKQTSVAFDEFLFALWIMVQVIAQACGAYYLYDECLLRSHMISPNLIKTQVAADYLQFVMLVYLFANYEEKRLFLGLPITFLFIYIFVMQKRLLELILPKDSPQINYRSVNYQNMFIGLGTCIVFYVFNLSNLFFLIYTFVYLVPQIKHNFEIGGKIHYTFQNFALYTLPKFSFLYYLKMYSGNIFHLEPALTLFIICIIIVGIKYLIMAAQKKYGSRAIVPKFMIPKNLANRFKFFVIQAEADDKICSICISDLGRLPPGIEQNLIEEQNQDAQKQGKDGSQLKNYKQSPKYKQACQNNKVVVTPCKHQFHYPCLVEWTQTKLQCPNCRRNIPPVDEE